MKRSPVMSTGAVDTSRSSPTYDGIAKYTRASRMVTPPPEHHRRPAPRIRSANPTKGLTERPFRQTDSDCSLLLSPSIDSTIFLILNIRCMCYYYRYLVTLPTTRNTYIHHTCCRFCAPSAREGTQGGHLESPAFTQSLQWATKRINIKRYKNGTDLEARIALRNAIGRSLRGQVYLRPSS